MKKINCPNLAKNLLVLLILSLVFAVLFSGSIYALSSDNINLQGKIVRNDIGHEGMNVIPGSPACVVNGPSNDTCDFRVSYYTALTGGTLLLTEDFTNVEIGQFDGVFELSLGSGTVTTTLQCRDGTCNSPSEVISEYGDLYVELQFAPDGSTLTETFTRMPLEASPYAIFSKFAEGAHDAFKLSTSVSNESLENPSAGMIYFDTGSSQLKVYNGAEWQALSAGTSSSLWTDAGTYSYLTSTTDDLVLGGSSFSTGRFVFDMDGGSGSYFDVFNNDHSNKLFTILNSGNVGIGTATPGAKLEVGGDASTITNSTGNLTISTGGGNGNILLMPNGTGKVGIGTSSPTVALDVIGDIKASGVIRNVTVSGTTSTAAATAAKVVSIPNYTLTTGDLLSITFTNGNSVSNPTLNVNSTGAKNIRVGNTNATTTTMTISAGATLILYYDGTYFQMMGSQRTSDSNTYDRTYWGNAITAGATIYSYKLVMQSTDGKWYPLTLESGTGTTKTVSTQPFVINSPILYYATTTTVSPNTTFSNVYSEVPTTYLNYTANQGTWTSQLPIYLKGVINSSGNFVLDNTSYTSFLTQSLPTSEDGFVYILLGQMYSTTGIRLFQYHPIYEYKNGRVQPYNPSHTHNWGSILNADGVYMDYRPSNIACSSDQILKYDSINSRWICADDNAGTGDNWGSQVVITNSTLTGNGTSGSPLGIALSNANTWTGMQTFRGLTVDSATATDDRIITSITTGGSARYDGTLTNADLTAARTWTLPNATGTIALGTGTTSQLAYWTSTNTLGSLDYSGWDTNVSDDVTNFLGLTDTPGSYSGSGNYLVRVNSTATALEFVEASAFTDTDNYVDSVDFNAVNGVLTLGRTGALSDLTTSLDGRYALSSAGMPTGTEGQMLYNNAGVWTSFSGMYWDDTNNRLGIGTTSPTQKLEVAGNVYMNDGYLMQDDIWGMKWQFAGTSDTVEMNQAETAWKFNVGGGGVTKYRFNSTKSGSINGPILDLEVGGNSIFYGKVGIGTTSPTAYLHLKAGTSSANTAPLKFTTGANLATPESGAMEWDGSRLYITNTTPTRNTIAYTSDIPASDNYGSWTARADTGADQSVTSGYVLDFEGSGGVATSITANKITIGTTGVLEDLNTLGAATVADQFIVSTAAGTFAYETGVTARTSLGATTVGSNLFTLANPSAVTFLRINADNSISTLDATSFRAAIGAGTGNGTVTSVATGTGLTGGTITTTGTISLDYSNTLGSNGLAANNTVFGSTGVLFEGSSSDTSETLLTVTNPTADNTITLPNSSGTIALTSDIPAGHNPVTLIGENYLSLSGQQITANKINLASNVTGTLPIGSGGTNSTTYTSNQFLWYSGGSIVASGYDQSSFAGSGHSHNWSQITNGGGIYMNYRPNNTPCGANQVLKYDTTNSRWICADDNAGTGDNWGSQVVITNSTLTGNGTSGSPLGIALSNANTWTGSQTFNADTYFAGSGIWKTSGNVGIGTTSPTAALQIDAPNGVTGLLINGGTTDNVDLFKMVGNANTQRLILQRTGGATTFLEAGGSIGLFGTSSNHDFRIRTNYIDRLSITTSGNVGIGTTSPSNELEVTGDVELTNLYDNDSSNFFDLSGCGTTATVTGISSNGAVTCSAITGFDNYGSWTIAASNGTAQTVGSGQTMTIAQGNGISTSIGGTRTVTISTNATTCGAGEYSYWTGSAWACRADNTGSATAWDDIGDPDASSSIAHGGFLSEFTFNSITTGSAFKLSSTSTLGTASNSSKMLEIARSGANTNTAHTAYGIYSTVTNTNATSGTNIAGYFSASGATTANYGLIVESGNVGIGTTTPAVQLHTTGGVRFTGLSSASETTAVMINSSGDLSKRTLGSLAFSSSLSFLNLSDTPGSYSGSSNYLVRVNSTATALEFVEASAFTDTDNYVDSVSFNTEGDGVLTLGRTGTLPDLTTDLDGRYLQSLRWDEIQNPQEYLTLDHGMYSTLFTFNSITSSTAFSMSSSSLSSGYILGLSTTSTALTEGGVLDISASGTPSSSWTGNLARIEYNNGSSNVNGSALKVGLLGASAGSGTALNVTTSQTGAAALALRVNDDSTYTDPSPFVVDANGNVGVGVVSPTSKLVVNTLGYSTIELQYNDTPVVDIFSNVSSNIFIGLDSGSAVTSGYGNIALGDNALSATTIGTSNTAIGYYALDSNVAKQGSTAIGYQAMMYANNTATQGLSYNTAVGYQALVGSATASANTGMYNTAIGHQSMTANTSGSYNSTLGVNTLLNNSIGQYNVAIGFNSLFTNVAKNASVAIGYEAMRYADNTVTSSTSGNIAIGYQALMGSTTASSNTGTNNVAIGYQVLYGNTTGSNSVLIGTYAGSSNIRGSFNVGIGSNALQTNVAKFFNVAVGYNAMAYANSSAATGSTYNTALGANALRGSTTPANNTGVYNTSIGGNSGLSMTSGSNNALLGYYAGYNITTGSNNTGIGYNSLYSNTTGRWNTAVGDGSLRSNITGSANTTLGNNAGRYQADGSTALTDPEYSIYIGYNAKGKDNNDNNSIVIGYDAIGLGANTVVLGNDSIVTTALKGYVGIGVTNPTYRLQLPNTADNAGKGQANAWVTYSDISLKENIQTISGGLDKIMALRGVTFDWKGQGVASSGFIAQEVESIIPDLVSTDSNGLKSLDYGRFTPYLVEAIKEQQLQIQTAYNRIEQLENINENKIRSITTPGWYRISKLDTNDDHSNIKINNTSVGSSQNIVLSIDSTLNNQNINVVSNLTTGGYDITKARINNKNGIKYLEIYIPEVNENKISVKITESSNWITTDIVQITEEVNNTQEYALNGILFGISDKLEVKEDNVKIAGDLLSLSVNSSIGDSANRWNDIYAKGTIRIGSGTDGEGAIRFNVQTKTLEFSNNGVEWLSVGDLSSQMTISPEYAGAILFADGSDNSGIMTSDAVEESGSFKNYYEWVSTKDTPQDYDILVRITLPADFLGWKEDAIYLDFMTENSVNTDNNSVGLSIIGNSGTDVQISGGISKIAGAWERMSIKGADITQCNSAGETCTLRISLTSSMEYFTRVGDITLNYNRSL